MGDDVSALDFDCPSFLSSLAVVLKIAFLQTGVSDEIFAKKYILFKNILNLCYIKIKVTKKNYSVKICLCDYATDHASV